MAGFRQEAVQPTVCFRDEGLKVAQNVFERSANRSNGYNVAYVNSSGNVNNNNARNGNRCAPDYVTRRDK